MTSILGTESIQHPNGTASTNIGTDGSVALDTLKGLSSSSNDPDVNCITILGKTYCIWGNDNVTASG